MDGYAVRAITETRAVVYINRRLYLRVGAKFCIPMTFWFFINSHSDWTVALVLLMAYQVVRMLTCRLQINLCCYWIRNVTILLFSLHFPHGVLVRSNPIHCFPSPCIASAPLLLLLRHDKGQFTRINGRKRKALETIISNEFKLQNTFISMPFRN